MSRVSSSYAGFAALLRLALRRDRVKLPVWIVALGVMAFYVTNALRIAYPHESDIKAITGFMNSPAGTVMSGPGYGLDDPTHATAFAAVYTLYLYLGAAFMSVLLVSRHTAAEEESGRLELVRAAEVGRHTPLAVAGALVAGSSLALGAVSALCVLPAGYGAAGTWLFGASMAMISLVFGAVALVTAQITEHSRSGTGLASLVIGVAVVVRGAGDVLQEHGSWLSWLSPIAWAQQTRMFYDDRWWPLLLGVVLAVALFAVAAALQAHRDLGAGLLRPRPGHRHAPAYLRNVLALALRLERGAMVGWGAATLLLGAMYGALTDSVQSSLGDVDNDLLVHALGGDADRLVDGYLATCTLVNGYVALCYALVAAHRLTAEERAGRSEIVLATAVSRPGLLLAGFTTSMVGTTVLLLLSGVGLGGTAALVTGRGGYLGDGLLGAICYLPAIALLVGIGVLGFAFRPGWLNLAWIAAVYAMVVGYLGFALDLPDALLDLSPLSHVAAVPLETQAPLPLVVLALIAAALVVAAVARFRSRDIVTG
jgi:ABC-2 type transport system permease protein